STVRSESVITSKAHNNVSGGVNDSSATDPIEGDLKTAEVGLEEVSSGQLIQEVNISPDLSPTQREKIEEVILRNCNAFGLDGRLVNHDAKVDIQLKPSSVPVSLPPYPVSLANQEVIDKQIDSWLSLGVIEPSKSPRGAPVFIVYEMVNLAS
ncbi:hypothetical protein K435DRAFT_676979, partial [Dendrothele bispora CBS 962.96]